MIIKLTQSHIDRGCCQDPENCPVANALIDAFKCRCSATSEWLRINTGPDEIVVGTPVEVAGRISDYDASGRMTPFEFELDVEGVG